MPLPAVPYPATIEVTRAADDRASVAFRGNRYSVTPGLGGTELTLRHRLGTGTVEIFTPGGTLMVTHRLAPPGAGAMVRTPAHRAALEAVVLSQFSAARPCDRKANRPPGQAALTERAALMGAARAGTVRGPGPARRGGPPRLPARRARHGRARRGGDGVNASSDYQKLRAHLAFLRMTAAAEALPGELEHAGQGQPHPRRVPGTASSPSRPAPSTSGAAPAWSASRRCRPRSPSPTSTSPPSPRSTRS